MRSSTYSIFRAVQLVLLITATVESFHPTTRSTTPGSPRSTTTACQARGEVGPEETMEIIDLSSPELQAAASKFKIVTCMSTSCAKRRKNLGLDSLSTFAAFYVRSKGEGDVPVIEVAEGPCLGACKMAPCVAVEHDDFVGSVALEGMTDREFSDRVFHNIITEEDADRVWSSVTNGVRMMAEEDESGEV